MGLLFGMLLGCASYTLLCKWLARKVKQEVMGANRKSVSLRKLAKRERPLGEMKLGELKRSAVKRGSRGKLS